KLRVFGCENQISQQLQSLCISQRVRQISGRTGHQSPLEIISNQGCFEQRVVRSAGSNPKISEAVWLVALCGHVRRRDGSASRIRRRVVPSWMAAVRECSTFLIVQLEPPGDRRLLMPLWTLAPVGSHLVIYRH